MDTDERREDDVEVDVSDNKLVYDEETLNLVDDFYKSKDGKDFLRKTSADLYEQIDTARELSSDYRERWRADYRMLASHVEKKTFPWKDCANAHVPITLEGMIRLYSRIMGEIVRNPQRMVAFASSGDDDEAASEIATQHTNFQLRYQIVDFKRQLQRAILMFLFGDVTCHSYRDEERKMNRHEMLTPDEVIRPYVFVSTFPDYSDLPWIAKLLVREKHWLQKQEGKYHSETLAKVLEASPTWDDEPELDTRDGARDVEGVQPSEKKGPYKLVQWEGWMDLPQQVNQRYVQVVMDMGSKLILYMTIHEMPSWEERERFDRQTRELELFNEATQQYMAMQQQVEQMQQQAAMAPQMGPGMPGMPPSIPQELPPPPNPPIWLEDDMTGPDPMVKGPIFMFRHAVCIEPLVGNLGLGLGKVMSDYNRAANTAVSQFVDSATANNAKGFLIDEALSFVDCPGGKPVLGPGRWNRVQMAGKRIQDHIHEFTPGPANPQMMQLVQALKEWGEQAGQTPDVLSGAAGKSGETWRGVSTRVEQAMKQISVIADSFVDFLVGVVENNCILNATFMDDEELFWVSDHLVAPDGTVKVVDRQERISRDIYLHKFRAHVTADMKFLADAQRTAEKDELVVNCLAIPQLAQYWPFMYEVVKQALEARGAYALVAKLPPPDAFPVMGPGVPGGPPGLEGGPPGAPPMRPRGPSGAGGPAPTGMANRPAARPQ